MNDLHERSSTGTRQPAARTGLARTLALVTALCAVPLVLFGGSVTTLGAGMAVEGWLVAEGHFLLFFPVDQWFRDTPTFVEHTHRLFGVLVGLASVATVIAVWRSGYGRAERLLAAGGLLLISAQGTLGGLRVLESSPRLAFLHGALAQAVFAWLCVVAFVLSRAWPGRVQERPASKGLRTFAWAASLAVYAQIVVGAWYRHGLRPTPVPDADGRLALHLVGAFVTLALVVAFARGLLVESEGAAARARDARRLGLLLAVQFFLGLTAWVGFRPGVVGPLEWAVSIAHVLVGGLLFAACACASLGCLRARGPIAACDASTARAGSLTSGSRLPLEAAR